MKYQSVSCKKVEYRKSMLQVNAARATVQKKHALHFS
jgi:hypothetical protein